MTSDASFDPVHAREQEFHDALAEELAAAPLEPRRDPDEWEQALIAGAQPIAGAKVLELGCGDGEITMQLADLGAGEITAIDISPGMVGLAERRAAKFCPGAPVRFHVAAAEETGFPDESFDLIVGKFVLHHLDFAKALDELHRLLKPGGRGVFIETSALNPVLRFARKHLTGRAGVERLGTPDEHPLNRSDLELLARRFDRSEVDFPNFFILHVFDRNVFKFRHARVTKFLYRIDLVIGRRLPRLRFLSYFLRVRIQR